MQVPMLTLKPMFKPMFMRTDGAQHATDRWMGCTRLMGCSCCTRHTDKKNKASSQPSQAAALQRRRHQVETGLASA